MDKKSISFKIFLNLFILLLPFGLAAFNPNHRDLPRDERDFIDERHDPKRNRPNLLPPSKTIPQKAISNKDSLNATLLRSQSSNSSSDFNGWWKLKTYGGEFGFTAYNGLETGESSVISDQYIYIDTSVNPPQVLTMYGTEKYPRTADVLDRLIPVLPPLPGVPNSISYYFQSTTELVNFYNPPLKGSFNPLLSFSISPTLKLRDPKTLIAYRLSNPKYSNGFEPGIAVYEKMSHPPKDTLNDNWNDPVLLFKYYVDLTTFQNPSLNKHSGGKNYVGDRKAKKIMKQFLGKGFTKTTPIRKIRVTNLTNYAPIGLTNDTWTTIYTGDPLTNEGIYSFITPGASVTIQGATGPLSLLNGHFENGVSTLNNGANYTLKNGYVDKGANGSFNDLYNSFLLNLDTSSIASIADPLTGFIDVPPGVTVKVTYRVRHDMEYPEFCAACAAAFYAIVRADTHGERRPYTPAGSARVVDTFAQLQAGLLAGTVVQDYRDDGSRAGQPPMNKYYHNWYDLTGFTAGTMINCPYPLNYNNPILEYDVALGNYLVNVQNLYFGIQGTLEEDQPDPAATFGYPPVIPGPGRAHFVGLVAPAVVSDGLNLATTPAGYATLGDTGYDFGNLNSYFFGEINPAFTGGKTIGYLYLGDLGFEDPYELVTTGTYAPENPNITKNPRIGRESLCSIYSEMMKWFNAAPPYNVDGSGNPRQPCEKIILECNAGGDPTVIFTIAEFMGKDRIGYRYYAVPKDGSELISFQDPNFPTVNQAAAYQKCSLGFMYVSMNKEKYPGSVFEGTKHHPKEVIYQENIFANSATDIAPNLFIGDRDDGYLGEHVQMNLIGCVDGREFGFSDTFENFPVNANTNLKLPDGTPVSPFLISARDFGGVYFRYGKSNISSYIQHKGIRPVRTPTCTGTDGGAALPISFEANLFPDFGLTPMTRAPIDGWTAPPPNFSDPTTWRFLYLEQAIELAKGPVKYRSKDHCKKRNRPPKCKLCEKR